MIAVDRYRFSSSRARQPPGDEARTKRIYLVDTRPRDLRKTLVADLLDLANPRGLGGFGDLPRFPFQTTMTCDSSRPTLGVLDDNTSFLPPADPPCSPNNEFITRAPVAAPPGRHPRLSVTPAGLPSLSSSPRALLPCRDGGARPFSGDSLVPGGFGLVLRGPLVARGSVSPGGSACFEGGGAGLSGPGVIRPGEIPDAPIPSPSE
ncbi:hypothetical protein GCM10018952_10890 [Streptosporangium vulgare]